MNDDEKKALDGVYDRFLARVREREQKQAKGTVTLYMSDIYLMSKVNGIPQVVYRTNRSDLYAICL